MPCARSSSTSSMLSRAAPNVDARSEEHTSELQSRQYLVCRLLLEKTNRANARGNAFPRFLTPRANQLVPRTALARSADPPEPETFPASPSDPQASSPP